MKTSLLALLSLCLGMGIVAVAQSPAQAPRTHQLEATQSTYLIGTVSKQGEKLTLVTDQRIWKVDNPGILKGHEGHYVRVNAHVYPKNGLLHITEVIMPTASESRENNQKSYTHRQQVCLPVEWSHQAAAEIGWVCYSTGTTVGEDVKGARGNTQ